MCESEAEARRLSEAAEQRQRLERLALMSGGGSMITSKSLATGDDDEEALKRMNVILKVRPSLHTAFCRQARQGLQSADSNLAAYRGARNS